jgi:hypothetical protein
MPRARDMAICLVGFEAHKAKPDLSDDSGFWLCVQAEDAFPFVRALQSSPAAFHDFQIEQRIGKQTRTPTLSAQIVRIEEGAIGTRVLIRPHPSYGPALY